MTSTDSAIRDRMVEILSVPKWTDKIDALRPDDILTINISSDEWLDLYTETQEGFRDMAKEAVLIIKSQRYIALFAA